MVKIVVFVAALFLGAVTCYPAQESQESQESQEGKDDRPIQIGFVPLEHGPYRPASIFESDEDFGDQPIIDTPAFYDPYFGNPFRGLFGGLENMLARMRQQLSQVLTRLPNLNDTDSGLHVSAFGDLGKGNTTSVTKIIDGHTVVINETEYKKEGPNGGAFVKISVIDVRPDGVLTTEPDTEIVTTAAPKDKESVEDSIENEIPKISEEANYDHLEPFDDVVAAHGVDEWPIDPNEPYAPFSDLSNDIDVNKYMVDAGVPPDPDAELIDSIEAELAYKNMKRPKFEKLTST